MADRIYDLEDRLICFSVEIIKITEKLPKTYSAIHLANQLSRSGTAPALNYGEAQSAESRSDFIHKMKIALKELRETNVSLKIMERLSWLEKDTVIKNIKECNELTAIFIKSIQTAQQNKRLK